MEFSELAVPGAWQVTPVQHADARGTFLEWYRADRLRDAVGHTLKVVQANASVSTRGVLRGIHFALVPPGQAKFVTVLQGSVMDYAVDVRVGSPTFGTWSSVLLDDVDRRAVYLSEGLGHAFLTLSPSATIAYLVSEHYAPDREFGVHPLDPDVGLSLPDGIGQPILSPRDASAPSLKEAAENGLLPDWAACLDYVARLDSEGAH